MAPRIAALVPLLAALPHVSAWGGLGHTTVAYIAQNFVSAKTASFAKNILGDTSTSYLANVATWADSYRYTAAGHFSAPLHYLDALDSPPQQCNVNYKRDCPAEGCIVSAIANYSGRAVDTSLDSTERQMALKWVIHFLGDVHQPLHVENLDIGGNSIKVTFDGVDTNLHASWDTSIPEKAHGNYTKPNALAWAKKLTTAIKTGAYKSQASSWLTGLNAQDGVSSTMVWAAETNAYVCSTVLVNGVDAVSGKDLGGDYYTAAVPVVDLQIARAGYRLAAWLDAMVDSADPSTKSRRYNPGSLEARGDYKYEPWQMERKQARAEFGHDCGCDDHVVDEEHEHEH